MFSSKCALVLSEGRKRHIYWRPRFLCIDGAREERLVACFEAAAKVRKIHFNGSLVLFDMAVAEK
jgi:hypothetical protein